MIYQEHAHRKLRQAFDAILRQFSSNDNRKSMLSANGSFQAQNSTCSTLLQTMLLYETCIILSRKFLWDVNKDFWHQWRSLVITTLSARAIYKQIPVSYLQTWYLWSNVVLEIIFFKSCKSYLWISNVDTMIITINEWWYLLRIVISENVFLFMRIWLLNINLSVNYIKHYRLFLTWMVNRLFKWLCKSQISMCFVNQLREEKKQTKCYFLCVLHKVVWKWNKFVTKANLMLVCSTGNESTIKSTIAEFIRNIGGSAAWQNSVQ